VFIPKCRRKTLYGDLRQYLGEVFRRLPQQKESRIEEGHLLSDHVHVLIAIPPKHAVARVVGIRCASATRRNSLPSPSKLQGLPSPPPGAALHPNGTEPRC
jgi:REP element-mobilizing transposase RayT